MSIDFDAVKALAEPQLKLWEQAIQAKVISEEEGNRRKGESLQAAMEELNRKEELKKGKSSEEFTAAYIDRNPGEELLNTRDMWKRHHEAVQSDAEAWRLVCETTISLGQRAGRCRLCSPLSESTCSSPWTRRLVASISLKFCTWRTHRRAWLSITGPSWTQWMAWWRPTGPR
eukprot:gene7122-biopygen4383